MIRIGVLLSGCGVYDGSEIQEAVLCLLALDKANIEAVCMAPNIEQYDVVNHLTGKAESEKRNVLVESARIARGKIRNIADVKADDIDGLIIPGGSGAIKNLSNFAVKGKDAFVNKDTHRLLNELVAVGKPIGALCIAPVTLTKALEGRSIEVTIGADKATAEAIVMIGGRHKICAVDMIHVDEKNKVVSTPAYMLGPGIKEIAFGIEKLVNKVLELTQTICI